MHLTYVGQRVKLLEEIWVTTAEEGGSIQSREPSRSAGAWQERRKRVMERLKLYAKEQAEEESVLRISSLEEELYPEKKEEQQGARYASALAEKGGDKTALWRIKKARWQENDYRELFSTSKETYCRKG